MREHLLADLSYQSRLLRFLENHDEPRIADKMPADARAGGGGHHRHPAGRDPRGTRAVRGAPRRAPVFLARPPRRAGDEELAAWYRNLLHQVAEHAVRTGAWQLLQAEGWPGQRVRPQPDRLVVGA